MDKFNPAIFRLAYRRIQFLKRNAHAESHGAPSESRFPKEPYKGIVGTAPLNDDDKWFTPPPMMKMDLLKPGYYEYRYREGFRGANSSVDYLYNKYFLSAIFWAWVFWRFWWDSYVMLLEPQWGVPDPKSFTDKELGLPPDGSLPERIYGKPI